MTPSDRPTSRREILVATVGGVAALVAQQIATPSGSAEAASGDSLVLGQDNVADAATTVAIAGVAEGSNISGMEASGAGLGPGLVGASLIGAGVLGVSGTTTETGAMWGNDVGVSGRATQVEAVAGVAGDADYGAGVLGTSGVIGVLGSAQVVGVLGTSFDPTGTAIYGVQEDYPLPAPRANTAVHARRPVDTIGYALYVDGRLKLRLSGRTSVASGAASKKITVAGVTTSSIVVAMFQTSEPGSYIRASVPAAGYFTVFFNRTLLSGATIGWVVVG